MIPLNFWYALAWVAIIFGAIRYIPKALRYDRWAFDMDNLDDEELAAALAEFPDLLEWRTR